MKISDGIKLAIGLEIGRVINLSLTKITSICFTKAYEKGGIMKTVMDENPKERDIILNHSGKKFNTENRSKNKIGF